MYRAVNHRFYTIYKYVLFFSCLILFGTYTFELQSTYNFYFELFLSILCLTVLVEFTLERIAKGFKLSGQLLVQSFILAYSVFYVIFINGAPSEMERRVTGAVIIAFQCLRHLQSNYALIQ